LREVEEAEKKMQEAPQVPQQGENAGLMQGIQQGMNELASLEGSI